MINGWYFIIPILMYIILLEFALEDCPVTVLVMMLKLCNAILSLASLKDPLERGEIGLVSPVALPLVAMVP